MSVTPIRFPPTTPSKICAWILPASTSAGTIGLERLRRQTAVPR